MVAGKLIIIHVDAFRRDYLCCWMLSKRLEEQGAHVLLSSRQSTSRLLKFCKPDIVITPNCFTLSPRQVSLLVKSGVHLIVLEAEGVDQEIGVATSFPSLYDGDEIDYQNFARILVWNRFTHDWLLSNRPINENKTKVVGNLRLSPKLRGAESNMRRGLSIGILSRFELINPFHGNGLFESLLNTDPFDPQFQIYIDRCGVDAESLAICSQLIKSLLSRGVEVSIRPHPNENLKTYRRMAKLFGDRFHVDNSPSINEWFSKIDVLFGTVSSAYIDAFAAGMPIVSSTRLQRMHFRSGEYKSMLDSFECFASDVNSIEEAIDACMKPGVRETSKDQQISVLNSFCSFYEVDEPYVLVEQEIAAVGSVTQLPNTLIRLFNFWFWAFLIDFIVLVSASLQIQSKNKVREIRSYHFNRFLHFPSKYMKNLYKNSWREG